MNEENGKKSIWKRPIIYIILAVLVLAAGAGVSIFMQWQQLNTQRLNLAGYIISVPKDWEIRLEDEIAIFYNNESGGAPIGKARLINQEVASADFGKWFSFETAAVSEKTSDKYAAPLTEQNYSEGGTEYTEYVFSNLPNPQPYHFALYFDNDMVSGWTARKILKSFIIPDPGKNPPPKNIAAPTEEEAAPNSVYRIDSAEQITVHNTAFLDRLMNAENTTPAAFSILYYTKAGDSLALSGWRYLDFDGEKMLLYEYYQIDDGTYSYNNNPRQILKIQKVQDEGQGLTIYQGLLSDNPAEYCNLFDFPTNPYENQKDALFEHKETYTGDNAGVGAILDSLPTPGLSRTQFSLQTEQEPYGITIDYEVTDAEKAYPDGKLNRLQLEKNAAVVFSLVSNADQITINITNGDEKETLSFNREKTEEYFETDVRSYSEEPEKFDQYLEDVQNMPPSTPTPSAPSSAGGGGASGGVLGEVVYSSTVTIPSGMLVTHPRTGEKVVVDPYAERYGYAQYLDKPIQCVIYRAGSGYRAVASCGGTVLLEYELATERDKDYAISMIQAYGG